MEMKGVEGEAQEGSKEAAKKPGESGGRGIR